MVNLELVSLKVKCERQYQTIIKLQDEKIDLFKENQELKEVIDEIKKVVNNQINYREFVDIVNAIEEILDKVDKNHVY